MSHHAAGDKLPLFRSPLLKDNVETSYPPRSADSEEQEESKAPQEEAVFAVADGDLHHDPKFHEHKKATNEELFYDLFFVANLSVFTNVHEVNDRQSLAQYVGFFCILWFTWYQVGLYDVRFYMDSVFERAAKACQFGVMIGFAVVGPNFDVGSGSDANDGEGPSLSAFRALSLILMASRLVLVLQYLQCFWFARDYTKTRTPLMIIAATYLISALVYLGLYFTFSGNGAVDNHTYIVWYVVAVLETLFATIVSSKWRVISFRDTHLVERMSLLTLIILGEGVMGIAERCQNIVKSQVFGFDGAAIGNIISAVLIIYFIYMLYFDWVQEEFGTIREQIWAFLHFPLHLFLVLAVEGIAQTIAWGAAMSKATTLGNQWDKYNFTSTDGNTTLVNHQYANATTATWQGIADYYNTTATNILYGALVNAKSYDATVHFSTEYTIAENATAMIRNGTNDVLTAVNAAQWTFYTLYGIVFQLAGFEAPENSTESDSFDTAIDFDSDPVLGQTVDALQRSINVYALTFVYLFVSIGLVIMLCTLLAALSKRDKRAVHYVRLAASGFVGLALALLAVIAVTAPADSTGYAWDNYVSSPWLLPTIVLAMFIVVMLNSVRFPSDSRRFPSLVTMRSRST